MKEIITTISLCFLLLTITSASSLPQDIGIQNTTKILTSPEEAPNWAVGNFTGTWGLNIWGGDWFPLGTVDGYYGEGFLRDLKIGRFIIECGGEQEGENGTRLEGIFFGPFLLGKGTNLDNGNESAFVGIGEYNETSFRWRVMSQKGPVLYMKGTFSRFE